MLTRRSLLKLAGAGLASLAAAVAFPRDTVLPELGNERAS
ncbi:MULTISPECIES: twin-arginine translocation signal domain-containing protein [Rhizobium/Agrobacterium group]